jgi:hypothetical protein
MGILIAIFVYSLNLKKQGKLTWVLIKNDILCRGEQMCSPFCRNYLKSYMHIKDSRQDWSLNFSLNCREQEGEHVGSPLHCLFRGEPTCSPFCSNYLKSYI